MPAGEPPRHPLPWLSAATLAAAVAASRPPDAFTRRDVRAAVQDVILAHHPALPFTLIGEVVAYVLAMD